MIGCFFEGETAAITGGILAHRHLLVLWQVTVAAAFGAGLADIAFFLIGRRYRTHPRIRALMDHRKFAKAMNYINRKPSRFAMAFRFIPGMRIIGPIALAQSSIGTTRFVVLSSLSSVVWAVAYTVAGHTVGRIIGAVVGRVRHVEYIVGVAGVVILIVLALRLMRSIRLR